MTYELYRNGHCIYTGPDPHGCLNALAKKATDQLSALEGTYERYESEGEGGKPVTLVVEISYSVSIREEET